MPRRRPYRLQMRNRNVASSRSSSLGGFAINSRMNDESKLGYMNRRMGFVEDFGEDGLVALESTQQNEVRRPTVPKRKPFYKVWKTTIKFSLRLAINFCKKVTTSITGFSYLLSTRIHTIRSNRCRLMKLCPSCNNCSPPID